VFLTFLNRPQGFKKHVGSVHEPTVTIAIPLVLLALGSLFIGYLTKDMIIGLGSTFWGQSLFQTSEQSSYLEAEYLPYHIRALPLLFT